jgi:hypothetical protein
MKKVISLFIILIPLCCLFPQTIKGTVVTDSGTRIANAQIYIDGTKTGTFSGEDGSFTLNVPGNIAGNVVFRKDNYETFTTPISKILNKTLKIVLLKSSDIEEVRIVPYTEEAYRNYINYFLSNFIGYDKENVRIKNQRSLKFSYDSKNKILKVKAPKTLIIENKNLGYEIHYNLVNFSTDFNTQITNCLGTSLFIETKNNNKTKVNRINAYYGSLLHFFRSIYNNTVTADNFIVNHVIKVPNPKYPSQEELKILNDYMGTLKNTKVINIPDHISDIAKRNRSEKPYALAITKTLIPDSAYITRNGGEVRLTFSDILQVNYKKYTYDVKAGKLIQAKTPVVLSSFLHPEGETFEISKDGNFTNPGLLITEGDFSKNRIENMLPLDYQPGD